MKNFGFNRANRGNNSIVSDNYLHASTTLRNHHEDNSSANLDGDNFSSGDGSSSNTPSNSNSISNSNSNSSSAGSSTQRRRRLRDKLDVFRVGRTETRFVKLLRICVFGVLLMAAWFLSQATYDYTKSDVEQGFEDEFYSIASTIVDGCTNSAMTLNSNLRTFSTSITSEVQATFSSSSTSTTTAWPLVTIPYFEIKSQQLARHLGITDLSFAPVVPSNQKQQWETYAQDNANSWINQSKQVPVILTVNTNRAQNNNQSQRRRRHLQQQQQLQPRQNPTGVMNNTSTSTSTYTIPPLIHNGDLPATPSVDATDNSKSYYVPIWQLSPISQDKLHIINQNVLQIPEIRASIHHLLFVDTQTASVSVVRDSNTTKSPTSTVIYPVYSGTSPSSPVAGVVLASVPWISFFEKHVIEGYIYIVLEDSCEPEIRYSFKAIGPNVTYLGFGDFHDKEFDHLEVAQPFIPQAFDNNLGVSAQSEQLNYRCYYTLHLYPAKELQNRYLDTNRPAVLTTGVVIIFVIIIIFFWVYDCCVERRQEVNLTSAVQSNAIVSSLFPEQVRDRLLDSAEGGGPAGRGQTGVGRVSVNESTDFANRKIDESVRQVGGAFASRPIADLFPACTVLFADMVGFTAWSSVREPTDVFHLLESVFNAFDLIARRRGVFKVETIGDCYVAVTGLPEPRKDHARAMAKFSHECMVKMKQVVNSLESSLGPDTADLSMRFGLNSGPVVAGVLRGEKSRFQLFGDTVNLASRIESTGRRGRIHISLDTANALIAQGREKWVHKREDTVDAKGKGQLQTFWLQLKADSITSDNPSNEDGVDDSLRQVDLVDGATTNPSMDASSHHRRSSMVMEDDSEEESDDDNDDKADNDNNNDDDGQQEEQGVATKASTDPQQEEAVYTEPIKCEKENKEPLQNKPIVPAKLPGPIEYKKLDNRAARLIDWNVDVLYRTLEKIIELNNQGLRKSKSPTEGFSDSDHLQVLNASKLFTMNEEKEGDQHRASARKSVMGKFKTIMTSSNLDLEDETEIDPAIKEQLHEYVTKIASLHRNVNYHCFERASHVTMTSSKMIARVSVVRPPEGPNTGRRSSRIITAPPALSEHEQKLMLHKLTFGIGTDPLAQMAILFTALIRDVDHPGISINEIVKEPTMDAQSENGPTTYGRYNPLLAKQHSFDVAWDLLLSSEFTALRSSMFKSVVEQTRFRQLVFNAVMATDNVDQDLEALRKQRWEQTFGAETMSSSLPPSSLMPPASQTSLDRRSNGEFKFSYRDEFANGDKNMSNHNIFDADDNDNDENSKRNEKARLIMEYLSQASDASHAMQHWHIYHKWNQRCFKEWYSAYKDGRIDYDPSVTWFEKELHYFDYFIIPLARRLKETGILGVASDEYLSYAMTNRSEWEKQGPKIVAGYLSNMKKQ